MKKSILAVSLFILFITAINSQWQQTAGTPQGAGVTDMVVLNNGTIIVTTASYNWPNGQPGGLRRSTDEGATWQNISDIYNARTLWLGSTGKIFASLWPYPYGESAYYSTNSGTSWTLLLTLSGTNNIFSIATKNNDSAIFLGTRDGVRRSTNNGSSFVNLTNGFPANSWVRDLAISSEGYIAAATTNGLFISTNNGNLWQPVSGIQAGDTVVIVSFKRTTADSDQDELKAGTNNGKVYESDGSYTSLVLSGIFNVTLELTFFGTTIPATGFEILTFFPSTGGQQGGVAKSTNGGENFTFINEGLPNPAPVSAANITTNSGDVFTTAVMYAGLFQNQNGGAKIYKRTDVIGIQQISSNVPQGYTLSQNYPNPFNPSTNIEFAIPKANFVKLEVYDMLGKVLETLVSGELKAGTYKADWNAAKYPSGVYFYRISADDFIDTRKMILVK